MWGKILGFCFGFMFGKIFGAILGLYLGHIHCPIARPLAPVTSAHPLCTPYGAFQTGGAFLAR